MQQTGLLLAHTQNSPAVSLYTITALIPSSPTATTTAEMGYGTLRASESLRLLWETFPLLTRNVSAESCSRRGRSLEGGWSLPAGLHEEHGLHSDHQTARGEVQLNELVVVLGPFAGKVNLREVAEGCHVGVVTDLKSKKACQTKTSLQHMRLRHSCSSFGFRTMFSRQLSSDIAEKLAQRGSRPERLCSS
jgi:hypothetical protein